MLSIKTVSFYISCCIPLLVPLPRAGDDLVQLGKPRLPSELGLDLLRTRHEHRRIARPSLTFLNNDRPSRHAAHRLDHLEHGESLAIADVIDQPALRLAQRAQRQQVRLRKIAHMDVVPDAGSVLGRIVPPEDLDVRPPSQRHIENQWNQVRLRLMRLAVAFDRACHVEVAQTRIFKPVAEVHPPQHLFDQQLAFAIRIGGLQLCVFKDRRGLGLAIAGGSRAEDQPVMSGRQHCFEQSQ